MTVTTALRDFAHFWSNQVERWQEEDTRHTEKSYAQQFWSDLLRCFGVIPERIDLFERDAQRATTGRGGYIDLFWTGVVIGEAKSLGKDLDVAEQQALDYLSGGSIGQHEFPKFVLDRKSTRLNSSHVANSYAVFCLKKKKVEIHLICHHILQIYLILKIGLIQKQIKILGK